MQHMPACQAACQRCPLSSPPPPLPPCSAAAADTAAAAAAAFAAAPLTQAAAARAQDQRRPAREGGGVVTGSVQPEHPPGLITSRQYNVGGVHDGDKVGQHLQARKPGHVQRVVKELRRPARRVSGSWHTVEEDMEISRSGFCSCGWALQPSAAHIHTHESMACCCSTRACCHGGVVSKHSRLQGQELHQVLSSKPT
jgi:hypothetical protein